MNYQEIDSDLRPFQNGEVETQPPAEVSGITTQQEIDRERFDAGEQIAEEEIRETDGTLTT